MRTRTKILSAPALCLILSACAGPTAMGPQGSGAEIAREAAIQKEIVFKQTAENRDRLFNATFPVMAANTEYCHGNVAPMTGLTLWSIHTVGNAYKDAARNAYNLQGPATVQFVSDLSPAGRAGIRSGDFVRAVNGQELPRTAAAVKTAQAMIASAGQNPVALTLERGGKAFTKTITPVLACAYPVVYDDTPIPNAYFDGKKIVFYKGMLNVARNDNEIALVAAHELGHAAMKHLDKKRANAMAGHFGGLVADALLAAAGVNTGGQFGQAGENIGARAWSVPFEMEADYVGMYFMARAGYSTDGVADFWRRAGVDDPYTIERRSSHPTAPERYVAIERTHGEIMDKRRLKLQLVPNMQEKQEPAPRQQPRR